MISNIVRGLESEAAEKTTRQSDLLVSDNELFILTFSFFSNNTL